MSELGKLIQKQNEMSIKPTPNKHISNLALENWINDTLSQAEYYALPGCIKRITVGEGPGAKGK